MDNQALTQEERVSGVSKYVEVRGRQWQISPLGPKDFYEADQFLKRSMVSAIDALSESEAFKGFSKEERLELAKEALKLDNQRLNSPMGAEDWNEAKGGDGVIFLFWRSVRKNNETYRDKWEDFYKLFDSNNPETELTIGELTLIMETIERVSGREEYIKANPTVPIPRRKKRKRKKQNGR